MNYNKEKVLKIIKIAIILNIVLVFVVAIHNDISKTDEINRLIDKLNTLNNNSDQNKCELYYQYEKVYANESLANGVYWIGTDFYCVWTKDRNLTAIQETDYHETCHNFIDNQYEHFCEEHIIKQ
jgi:hypothetical protein